MLGFGEEKKKRRIKRNFFEHEFHESRKARDESHEYGTGERRKEQGEREKKQKKESWNTNRTNE